MRFREDARPGWSTLYATLDTGRGGLTLVVRPMALVLEAVEPCASPPFPGWVRLQHVVKLDGLHWWDVRPQSLESVQAPG